MPARAGCEEVRGLAPGLALGTAAGDDRARALEHLATCGACRRHVEELSSLADELLLLAPGEEPPAGFESRVLRELEPRPERRRRRALVPALAAAAAGIAVVGAGRRVRGRSTAARPLRRRGDHRARRAAPPRPGPRHPRGRKPRGGDPGPLPPGERGAAARPRARECARGRVLDDQ